MDCAKQVEVVGCVKDHTVLGRWAGGKSKVWCSRFKGLPQVLSKELAGLKDA